MQSFEVFLLGVGVVIIAGFFAVALWRTRYKDDVAEIEPAIEVVEPTLSDAKLGEVGVEAQTIEPIIVNTASSEPKSLSPDFESEEPMAIKINGGTAVNVYADEEPVVGPVAAEMAEEIYNEDRIRAAGKAALAQAKEDPKSARANPFAKGSEWMGVIKEAFKERTSHQAPQVQPRQESLPNLVVIYVVAPRAKSFYGSDIAQLLEEQGLQFGRMDVFHKSDEFGREIFSVASAVEPGTFDYDNMSMSSTPGLCCYFNLDRVVNPKQSFRALLSCVYELGHFLRADLLDDNREPLSQNSVAASLARIKAKMAESQQVNAGNPVNVE